MTYSNLLSSSVLAILITATPLMARAQSYADLWWNPSESGWGITFSQQESTIFATWFIYGTDGKPTWVASTMVSSQQAPTIFTGPVYSTAGTPYSTVPFVSANTSVAQVGTATVNFQSGVRGTLTYSINGTTLQKPIERQALVAIPIDGSYNGKAYGVGPFGDDDTTYKITKVGSSITINRASFFAGTCIYTGTMAQYGTRIAANGTYQCADFSTGTWSTSDMALHDSAYLSATIASSRLQPTAGTFSSRFLGLKL